MRPALGLCAMSVPPSCGKDTAGAVGDYIPGVADHVRQDPRADDFEQHAPDAQVKSNLGEIRHLIVVPQPEPAVEQQHQREGARDQKQIVEMRAQEDAVEVGLQPEAIEGIKSTAHRKQWIAPIEKASHSNATTMRPKMTARVNFKSNV